MSTRRSRPPRARKSRHPEAQQAQDVAIVIPRADPVEQLALAAGDPSTTSELAALEAGWDELLA
jgi:hypothetical protein